MDGKCQCAEYGRLNANRDDVRSIKLFAAGRKRRRQRVIRKAQESRILFRDAPRMRPTLGVKCPSSSSN